MEEIPGVSIPSVAQAAGAAFRHTERILFKPFDVSKWFVMGFSAFLANLGGGLNFQVPGAGGDDFSRLGGWIHSHLSLVIVLGITLGLLLLVLGITFVWLSSRGKFMFLSNVVHNEAQISAPWRRFKAAGNRLFRFQLLALLIMLGIVMLLALTGIAFAAPLGQWFHGGTALVVGGVALLVLLGLVALCAVALFFLVLHDFAVPLMYLRDLAPGAAMAAVWKELLPGRVGLFARFYLLKLVLGLGAGALVVLAGCFTCCLGFLPYLSSVLCLPISVFFRSYALDLLSQIDPGLDLFTADVPK